MSKAEGHGGCRNRGDGNVRHSGKSVEAGEKRAEEQVSGNKAGEGHRSRVLQAKLGTTTSQYAGRQSFLPGTEVGRTGRLKCNLMTVQRMVCVCVGGKVGRRTSGWETVEEMVIME